MSPGHRSNRSKTQSNDKPSSHTGSSFGTYARSFWKEITDAFHLTNLDGRPSRAHSARSYPRSGNARRTRSQGYPPSGASLTRHSHHQSGETPGSHRNHRRRPLSQATPGPEEDDSRHQDSHKGHKGNTDLGPRRAPKLQEYSDDFDDVRAREREKDPYLERDTVPRAWNAGQSWNPSAPSKSSHKDTKPSQSAPSYGPPPAESQGLIEGQLMPLTLTVALGILYTVMEILVLMGVVAQVVEVMPVEAGVGEGVEDE